MLVCLYIDHVATSLAAVNFLRIKPFSESSLYCRMWDSDEFILNVHLMLNSQLVIKFLKRRILLYWLFFFFFLIKKEKSWSSREKVSPES